MSPRELFNVITAALAGLDLDMSEDRDKRIYLGVCREPGRSGCRRRARTSPRRASEGAGAVTTATAPRSAIVRSEKARHQREDCRLAAMILLAEPEAIGDEDIGSFLLRVILEIDRDIVARWLRRVGVNPWRPTSKLTGLERRLLAGLLARASQIPAFSEQAAA